MKLTRKQASKEWKLNNKKVERPFPAYDLIESNENGSFIYAIIDRNDETSVIFRPQGENKKLMKKLAQKVAKELSILHYQLHGKAE